MISSMQYAIDSYYKFEDLGDSTVRKWFLMNSSLQPITIALFYLYFVLIFGPKYMKSRKPFNIDRIIIIYNIIQVVFNIILFKETLSYILDNLHSFQCFKIEYSESESAIHIKFTNWLFVINKLMDLFDTVFFVLKKKNSHVTFLHVYHHTLTFVGCWFVAKYFPGGQIVVLGVLNSFVHTVMYGYYLLSLSKEFKKVSLFLKKRITQLQIAQFIIAAVYGIYSLTDESCSYPKYLMHFGLFQGVLMITLFVNFYRKAYSNNQQSTSKNEFSHINGVTKKIN